MGPNFKQAYQIANESVLLTSHTITSLPVDIKSHISLETDIALCSYKMAFEKWGLNMSLLGSDDAELVEKSGKYIIFYNSEVGKRRIRWSLAHEAGHFYLGHELRKEMLSDEEYNIQEVEANFFAAQVLMPDQIIHELVSRGERIAPSSLMKWFQVSKLAAEKRIETLKRKSEVPYAIQRDDYSQEVLIKFRAFIDGIKPKYEVGSLYVDLEEDERQAERDSWMYEW